MFEKIIERQENDLFPLDLTQIGKAEEKMGIEFPYELKRFYEEVGCGFIGSKEGR